MLSLYRRHRPRTFDDVVGQEHIVRTLRNAIALDKVHHAYLFVGSRGTGKTSMAKLLASALNAEGGPRADFRPDEPAAVAIARGTSLDVVEMDAASNNSVDDIRELRENVGLAPMGGGRRVYILDEAHMLSTSAWNAFLKTLEEPPPHVVFVLATTEAHKVPATIIDRCHRFDFHRPGLEQIAGVLRRVADEEGIEVPDAAVAMIARSATGSFRDALGTLEQLVTYGGRAVALDDVLEVLGVADAELVFAAADALIEHDAPEALRAVARVSSSGRDLGQYMRDLVAHLRHLFVVQTLGEVPDSFAVTAEHTDRLARQAARLGQGEILRAIDLLSSALSAVKDGSEPRIQAEVALLKAVQPAADLSLQALAFRIEQLERRLSGARDGTGGPAAAPAGAAPAPGVAPVPPASAAPAPSPMPADPARAPSPEPDQAGQAPRAAAEPAAPARRPEPEPAAPAARPAAPDRAPAAANGNGNGAAPAAVPPAPPAAPMAVPSPSVDLDRLSALWPAVVEAVCGENGMVGAALADARPVELEGERLVVAFPAAAAFKKRKAEDQRALLQSALRDLTGRTLACSFELRADAVAAGPPTLTEDELLERLKQDFEAREILEEEAPASAESPNGKD